MGFEYPRNVHFKCERCALCCGDTGRKIRRILLLKIEANRIMKKTAKSVTDFADKAEGCEPYVYEMKKTENGKCVFLKDDACRIYRIRPLICRFYPFELRSVGKGRYVFAYTNECPSIGHGPELKRDYFERLFARSTELMKSAGLG